MSKIKITDMEITASQTKRLLTLEIDNGKAQFSCDLVPSVELLSGKTGYMNKGFTIGFDTSNRFQISNLGFKLQFEDVSTEDFQKAVDRCKEDYRTKTFHSSVAKESGASQKEWNDIVDAVMSPTYSKNTVIFKSLKYKLELITDFTGREKFILLNRNDDTRTSFKYEKLHE